MLLKDILKNLTLISLLAAKLILYSQNKQIISLYQNQQIPSTISINTKNIDFTDSFINNISFNSDFNYIFSNLTTFGDFNHDGNDEIALFIEVNNQNQILHQIVLLREIEKKWIPFGCWHSDLKENLNFKNVLFANSGDYNHDQIDDIALIYQNPNSEIQKIFVLESEKNFTFKTKLYYSINKSTLNFSHIVHSLSGDFNNNSLSDLALLYQTNNSNDIIILESNIHKCFNRLFYQKTFTDSITFNNLCYIASGNFISNNITEIALVSKTAHLDSSIFKILKLQKEKFTSQSFSLPSNILDYSLILNISPSNLIDKSIIVTYLSNDCKIIKTNKGFYFDTIDNKIKFQKLYTSQNDITDLIPIFINTTNKNENLITPCIWKNEKKGALFINFTPPINNIYKIFISKLDSIGINATYLITDTYKNYINKPNTDIYLKDSIIISDSNINYYPMFANITKNASSRMSYPNNLSNLNTPSINTKQDIFSQSKSLNIDFNWNELDLWLNSHIMNPIPLSVNFNEISSNYKKTNNHQSNYLNFKKFTDYILNNNLWIDSQENISKYILERNNYKLTYYKKEKDKIYFAFDDFLNDDIYNTPITLKIKIPNEWITNHITAIYSDHIEIIAVSKKEDEKYILLNSIPDNHIIEIHNSILYNSTPKLYNKRQPIQLIAQSNPCKEFIPIFIIGKTPKHFYITINDDKGNTLQNIFNITTPHFNLYLNDFKEGCYTIHLLDKHKILSSQKITIKRQ